MVHSCIREPPEIEKRWLISGGWPNRLSYGHMDREELPNLEVLPNNYIPYINDITPAAGYGG